MGGSIALAVAVFGGCVAAYAADAGLKNWFGDPFIQLSNDIPGCPVPRGPLMDEAQMRSESHSRVERGTSCWMAGDCSQPNAYLYDRDIGNAMRPRLAHEPALAHTSLWVTVKRRFVWLEGCADQKQATALEQAIRTLPGVEHILVNVMPDPEGKPPYPALQKQK